MRGSTFSCPITFTPAPVTMPGVHRKSIRGFANVSLPPTWSASTCVLTMYSMRPGEIFWISARTAAVISFRPVSTSSTPSPAPGPAAFALLACTVMLPPAPAITQTFPCTW